MRHTRSHLLLLTLAATVASASAASSPALARSMNVRDEGYLGYKSSSGSQLTDEGHANGTLAGWVRVHFIYNGDPTVYAQFTIYTSGGSIRGHASGRLNNPNSTSPSFRGHLTLTGGNGRYAHAAGIGELFGVFYRRSYALSVQAISELRY